MTEINITKNETPWTDDQNDAINTTDKGVIVSAAAGSGKTAVLVERTIRILCDEERKIPADSLLAVTFTKDAANQMKTKLSKALDRKIAENPENTWISEQKDNLSLAKIMTINAFCLDLVNSNIHEFELESNIKILDEVDSAIIFNQSMNETFEYFYETLPDMMNNLIDRLTENNEDDLKAIVKKIYYFLRSLPFADRWCKESLSRLNDENASQIYVEQICGHYLKEIDKALICGEKFNMVLTQIPECDKKLNNKNAVESDISSIEGLKNALKTKEWKKIYKAFLSVELMYPKGVRMRVNAKDDTSKLKQKRCLDIIKACQGECKSIVMNIKNDIQNIGIDIENGIKDTAILFENLLMIYKKLEEFIWEKKLEKNSLDFSDVEIMSINLLVGIDENGKLFRTELAKEMVMKKLYQVILIDEFQDVNNLQDLIFKAISDTNNLDVMGSNVFVVGDVKQSIYRFRQSNPLLFINAKENAANKDFENLKLISLKQNFRSRKNVLDFVNFAFSMLMSRDIGEIEYNSDEKLYLGAKYEGEDFDTEILLVNPKDENLIIPEYLNFDVEHYAIACKIRELIDNHQQVFDVNKKQFRDCKSSDFCVLSRDNAHGVKMANALLSVGLKAYTEELDGYLRAREIAVMINLLKVIDNPMHDLELVSVLMSPIFGFSADDVAKIKLLSQNEQGYQIRFYQFINSFSESEDDEEKINLKQQLDDEVLKQKCIDTSACIKRLRFYSSGMTIGQLIRKIYDETDFFAVASNFENSKQTRANLRLLLEYAAAYEKNSNGGIAGFLRYIESAEKYEGKFKQAVTVIQDSNSVVVKTIHKSKGLEFPFVFLCGLSKDFKFKDENQPVILNENNDVSMKLLNHKELSKTKSIKYLLMQKNQHNATLSEELRLLYVAFTRAKEKLFIAFNLGLSSSGGVVASFKEIIKKLMLNLNENDENFSVDPSVVAQCKNFAQLMFIVLLFIKGNDKFLEAQEIELDLPKFDCGSKVSFNMFEQPFKELDFVKTEQTIDNSLITSKAEELKEKFKFEYHSDEIDKPSKITVTEIVRNEKEREYAGENPEFYPKLPNIAEEIDKLSSAEKGTYTHLFMELANYENASVSVKDELERLGKGGFMSPTQRRGVYVDAVKHFFESDLYKRLAKSQEVIREKDFMVAFRDLNLPSKYDSIVSQNGMLQGVADCLFKEDDGYVLIDYKTDNFRDRSELFKYQTQLELYKASLDMLLDMPIKSCYIYSFKLCDGVEIPLC